MKNLQIAPAGVGELLSNDTFNVPMYQRTYAWTTVQVRAMLTDITGAIKRKAANKGDAHFLGTVVVIRRDGKRGLEIVDGQQRLATASIIIAAIRDYHLKNGPAKAAEAYDRFLRTFHVPSGRYLPNLRLNEIDDRCYSNAILEEPSKRSKDFKWTIGSHRRLLDAYNCAVEHVASIEKISAPKDTVQSLYEIVEFIRANR